MMTPQHLLEQLVTAPNTETQRQLLQDHRALLNDEFAETMKNQALQLMRTDTQRALQIADLIIELAQLTNSRRQRGFGLWAEAVVRSIGLSEYHQALQCYNEALTIFENDNDVVSQATIQISRLWSLANLGHYTEAFEAGQWASSILETHHLWLRLATLNMNLAIIYSRLGDDAKALVMLDTAQHSYKQLGFEGELWWAQAEHNRSIALRNLGRFEDSIQASKAAQTAQSRLGHKIEVARIQQSLGVTYFVLGRYNEALRLMEQARDVFLADGLQRHALRAELYTCDCLLQLRRFVDVLEKCRRIRALFNQLETPLEEAQAIINEALACAGLRQYDEAVRALTTARRLLEAENSSVWVAYADLETAIVFYHQRRWVEGLSTAQACANTFLKYDLPVKEAEAYLVAARAASMLGRHDEAFQLVHKTLAVGESKDIPALIYQARHLLGQLARVHGDLSATRDEYEQAIVALERLRGQLMVEFRVNFQEDKQILYEDMVELCLLLKQPDQGLCYAERAKSRALLDLVAHRLDLQIRVKDESDRPLVEKLLRLRDKRDQIYRRWAGNEEIKERGWSSSAENQQVQQEVLELEKQITDLWHTLLIHKAEDYAQDAALWQVRTESVQEIQENLSDDTLLLEYFVIHDQFVVFLVTRSTIQVQRLAISVEQIKQALARLGLNMKIVPRSAPAQIQDLAAKAQLLLHQLYNHLLAPLATTLDAYLRLLIVPHGALHYLPFHALYNGRTFLVETHEISYLPSASLLRYCNKMETTSTERNAFGYSHDGQLPYALEEARTIAEVLGGQVMVEKEASRERLQEVAPKCQVIHLATHAEYHADQPLFSGLSLADGWFTVLDIFNLQLNASLVTLSACQTGRSSIGGGDELLGLMRAFLYAGASSLVLSLWAVEDRSTALLMETFYRKLAEGWSKRAALRHAQLQFIRESNHQEHSLLNPYTHPYFWAPFFLVGHVGSLAHQ